MFIKAKPIWLSGKEKEKNVQAEFIAEFFGRKNIVLKITGATTFRVRLNDKIIHYGPARTAQGYARVDEIKLTEIKEKNKIVIEAAGYNCNSYAGVMQDSFIQAEVCSDRECLVATGYDFSGLLVNQRVQKVMRYSFQRHFSEVWDMDLSKDIMPTEIVGIKLNYLKRNAPLPEIRKYTFNNIISGGKFQYNENKKIEERNFIKDIGVKIIGFVEEEISEKPFNIFCRLDFFENEKAQKIPVKLKEGEYIIIDCEKNHSGMINTVIKSQSGCKMLIAFDERLSDGKIHAKDWEMINIVQLSGKGDIDFSSFEVYGFRYVGIYILSGETRVDEVNVISYKSSINDFPEINCEDEEILGIYNASVETFRQNSVDIFTDCPTRERAGWLCDSYFSAQAEYAFTNQCRIEKDFVENYLLQSCPDIPQGMLPMCYPADHLDKNYIPQWAMWFVLEIEQYIKRDREFNINKYKDVFYKLLEFFEKYENEYGLLENLPAWNFVEWSKANEWTDGVNYPTNMLYSKTLKIIGTLFNDKELIKRSEKIKDIIIKQSFDGRFFHDRALRDKNNILQRDNNISEVCQYYAFMFDIADENTFKKLYDILLSNFSPGTDKWKNVEKVNAFMGMYLRMELLARWKQHEALIKEIKDFFSHMAYYTGTLWEYKEMKGSLNHGFASYVGALLVQIYN